MAEGRRHRRRRRGKDGLALFGARKIDLEGCSLFGFAVHPDMSAGLFDDALDGRQAESCSAPHVFRREEWFENAIEDLAGIPVPVSLTASITYGPGFGAGRALRE